MKYYPVLFLDSIVLHISFDVLWSLFLLKRMSWDDEAEYERRWIGRDRHLQSHFVFLDFASTIVTDQLAAPVPTRKNDLKLIKTPRLPLISYSKAVHLVHRITITRMQIVFSLRLSEWACLNKSGDAGKRGWEQDGRSLDEEEILSAKLFLNRIYNERGQISNKPSRVTSRIRITYREWDFFTCFFVKL